MIGTPWESLRLPAAADEVAWETFHENSKLGRYGPELNEHEIGARMASLYEALPYDASPAVPLPEPAALGATLDQAIRARASGRLLEGEPVTLEELSALLFAGYGVTRPRDPAVRPRNFRTVASAGALYPLELYLHAARVDGLSAGLYHYHPIDHVLRRLHEGDLTRQLSGAMVQRELALGASVTFFVTGVFERAAFKYGERGYRFTLLEAGQVAQNVALAAAALGLDGLQVGGYFDRAVDELLGLDGLTHSTLCLLCVGRSAHEGGGDG
jgi:SagB-type dehydrogenase family enzyme